MGGSMTLTGKAGGANYYFVSIYLGNNAALTVDTSVGDYLPCSI